MKHTESDSRLARSASLLTRSCGLAVGLFAMAELCVRLFFAENLSGRFDYGYHPTAGFVEKGESQVKLVRAGGRRFRPQEYSVKPAPGVVRILVIGDSVARGSSLESSYARRLADRMTSQGSPAEGWNLAVAGYGARRLQVVLRQALKYQPHWIVLHANNSNEFEDEREFRRSQEFAGSHPKNWLMKSGVIRRLYELKTEKVSWELLPEAVRARQGVDDADAETAASMNAGTLQRWDARVLETTGQSVALCRQAGVSVILITQARREASPNSTRSFALSDHGLDRMAQSLLSPGVHWISMKQLFESRDLSSLFVDSAHLRPEGHRVLAEAIHDQISKSSRGNPAEVEKP